MLRVGTHLKCLTEAPNEHYVFWRTMKNIIWIPHAHLEIHCNLVLTRVLGSKKADRVSSDYRVIILGVPTVIISSSNNVYPTHQYCDILKC